MKRLLIASFLLISSLAVLAITANDSVRNSGDRQKEVCRSKKCSKQAPAKRDAQQFFWEPVSRMMIVLP